MRGNLATLEMDLWRISPSGGQPERLTHHKNSNVAFPAAIDNHTVLYVSPAEDGSGPWLYAVDVDRKASRRVTVGLEQYLSVAASADGRRAVATVANPTASLWRVPISDQIVGEEESSAWFCRQFAHWRRDYEERACSICHHSVEATGCGDLGTTRRLKFGRGLKGRF